MKRILLAIILILMATTLCYIGMKDTKAQEEIDFVSNLPQNRSSVNINRDTLAYAMDIDEISGYMIPNLILYRDDNTFTFSYDICGDMYMGNYTENDNQVICKDIDANVVYVFDKIANGLKFNVNDSTTIKLIDKSRGYVVEQWEKFSQL